MSQGAQFNGSSRRVRGVIVAYRTNGIGRLQDIEGEAIAAGEFIRVRALENACPKADIVHRTIKDATVKRFYYENYDQLRQQLSDFVSTYNFRQRLKEFQTLNTYEFICNF